MFKSVIKNIAIEKNITLSESVKDSAAAIWMKVREDHKASNTSDSDKITLPYIEKLTTELSAVLPSQITEEIASTLSKLTKEATISESVEGAVCQDYFIFLNTMLITRLARQVTVTFINGSSCLILSHSHPLLLIMLKGSKMTKVCSDRHVFLNPQSPEQRDIIYGL